MPWNEGRLPRLIQLRFNITTQQKHKWSLCICTSVTSLAEQKTIDSQTYLKKWQPLKGEWCKCCRLLSSLKDLPFLLFPRARCACTCMLAIPTVCSMWWIYLKPRNSWVSDYKVSSGGPDFFASFHSAVCRFLKMWRRDVEKLDYIFIHKAATSSNK